MAKQGDTRSRLRAAALELFDRRGYDATTANDIAASAGMTERTFFRYFRDKREVLFDGEGRIRDALRVSVLETPPEVGPLDTLLRAFRTLAPMHEDGLAYLKLRHRIITETPALYERELAKLAALSGALASDLQERGVSKKRSTLCAQIGVAAFVQATHSWLESSGSDLRQWYDETFGELAGIIAE